MSSKRRRGNPAPAAGSESAGYAEAIRLLRGRRRPEHVPFFRKFYLINLNRHAGDADLRKHARAVYPADESAVEQEIQRDLRSRAALRGADTVLYFAGEKFCDLIEATDNPPVTDISVLRKIGNHTAMVLYARNI